MRVSPTTEETSAAPTRLSVPAGDVASGADVGADHFRRTMAAHPAGVVVVAGRHSEGPVGLTATSFTSVSLSPPLVSFYIDDGSQTWPKLREVDSFAVSLLTAQQHGIAARFAQRGIDRFSPPTPWHPGPGGLPLIDGAAGHLLCARHQVVAVGDHWLVVGRVVAAAAHDGHHPLVYHQGTYRRFLDD